MSAPTEDGVPRAAPEEPKEAATKLIDGIMTAVAGQPSKDPTKSVGNPRDKRLRLLVGVIEKTVGRLPPRAPVFRIAVAISLLNLLLVPLADRIETVWLRSVVQGLTWFLWAACAALLFEYLRRNKELWISRILNWVNLMGSVQNRDIDGIRAAAAKFDPAGQAP